jgi:broad specificity phosphatase PhoE
VSMPRDLVLIRHGESVGNVALHAERSGDTSLFTEEFATTPGHRWAITDAGVAQAQATGAWAVAEFALQGEGHFDRYYVSPYRRTRQTAARLGLSRSVGAGQGEASGESARWLLNRAFRERDWGAIGTISRAEFEGRPEYELSARQRQHDPLYWTPPGGESIADVAENRVRNILRKMDAGGASGGRVLAVTHGETMMAFRLVLERLSDEAFEALSVDGAHRLPNCAVLHYSPTGPDDRMHPNLRWLRQVNPVLTGTDPTDPAHWTMQVSEWQWIEFHTYDNETLLGW